MRSPAYLLFLLALPVAAQVRIIQGSDRITVDIDGKPFTAFFIGAASNKPYLHPLRSASEKIITRSFPMDLVEGEARDHPHHRGLWFTHGDVNGYDFWANEDSQKGAAKNGKGRVVLDRVTGLKSGKKSGDIEAVFEWQTLKGETLLTETRRMTFYSHPTLRTIDFDIVLKAGAEQVKFADTKEGTFAVRLTTALEEGRPGDTKKTGKMVSADGRETEKNVWGKPSPWVDYFGQVQGEQLGIAIMDHPANPRHPTYWHARAYGLFAANIFGLHDFENDKSKDGSLVLEPGQNLRFRYRLVIHPGDAQSADISGVYKKFAAIK